VETLVRFYAQGVDALQPVGDCRVPWIAPSIDPAGILFSCFGVTGSSVQNASVLRALNDDKLVSMREGLLRGVPDACLGCCNLRVRPL